MVLNAPSDIGYPEEAIRVVKEQVAAFEAEAHSILSKYETSSKSRLISVDQTRLTLQGLTLQQDELLKEALDCVASGLFRAAHVAVWQAFMDYLQEKLESDGLVRVQMHRRNWDWKKFESMSDIRESISEYQLIEVARDVGLLSKNEMKSLHGLLSTRNDCAHPSPYRPGLNESLGYVSDLIGRIAQMQPKTL